MFAELTKIFDKLQEQKFCQEAHATLIRDKLKKCLENTKTICKMD